MFNVEWFLNGIHRLRYVYSTHRFNSKSQRCSRHILSILANRFDLHRDGPVLSLRVGWNDSSFDLWSLIDQRSLLTSPFGPSGQYCSHFFLPCSTMLHSIRIDLNRVKDQRSKIKYFLTCSFLAKSSSRSHQSWRQSVPAPNQLSISTVSLYRIPECRCTSSSHRLAPNLRAHNCLRIGYCRLPYPIHYRTGSFRPSQYDPRFVYTEYILVSVLERICIERHFRRFWSWSLWTLVFHRCSPPIACVVFLISLNSSRSPWMPVCNKVILWSIHPLPYPSSSYTTPTTVNSPQMSSWQSECKHRVQAWELRPFRPYLLLLSLPVYDHWLNRNDH